VGVEPLLELTEAIEVATVGGSDLLGAIVGGDVVEVSAGVEERRATTDPWHG
jgi:hypothetical protein